MSHIRGSNRRGHSSSLLKLQELAFAEIGMQDLFSHAVDKREWNMKVHSSGVWTPGVTAILKVANGMW